MHSLSIFVVQFCAHTPIREDVDQEYERTSGLKTGVLRLVSALWDLDYADATSPVVDFLPAGCKFPSSSEQRCPPWQRSLRRLAAQGLSPNFVADRVLEKATGRTGLI